MSIVQGTWEAENGQASARGARAGRWKYVWLCLAALVFLALGMDAVIIEPYRIETTHFQIQGAVAASLKIAQLSDLHTHGIGPRERRLFAILAAEKPDAIVITGDSLGGYGGTYQECAEVYKQLHAPLGVWFVRGNWENDHPIHPARREREFYEGVGVHFLVNSNAELRPGVWLIGLNDPSSGTVRLDTAMAGVPEGAYTIAAFHAPGYFDHIAGKVDLVLAGHTHGGQVRIPLVHTFWLPKDCGPYLEGWYEKSGTKMYVNRGLGWSTLPIRFLCRPEVTIITIEPESLAS